jgi:hypothetical protein
MEEFSRMPLESVEVWNVAGLKDLETNLRVLEATKHWHLPSS